MADFVGLVPDEKDMTKVVKILDYLGQSTLPSGVLWDLDGTTIDTFDPWITKTAEVVRAHGGCWTSADAQAIFGSSGEVYTAHMAKCVKAGTGKEIDARPLFREIVEYMEREIYPHPRLMAGAREVMEFFQTLGIGNALVTASPYALAMQAMQSTGLEFSAVVTGNDDVPGKPAPDPYLLGATRLGVPIEKCWVFEDSPLGIEAGKTAGAIVFDVHDFPLEKLANLINY